MILHMFSRNICHFRHLSSEIVEEWNATEKADARKIQQLIDLVKSIVAYNMAHNGEIQACDLLMEIEQHDLILQYADAENHPRVCLYLIS